MTTNNPAYVFNRGYRGPVLANGTARAYARLVVIAIGIVSLFFVTGSFTLADSNLQPFVPAQGSTSPSNGDLNPYGLAVVPQGFPSGMLRPGQLLVSNFNNSAANGNLQGEGSTIVIMDPATGQQTGLFFKGKPPIGFTNALGIMPAGLVFAGSVFTTNSTSPAQNGGLLVINRNGHLVTTITSGTNGPWGLAINNQSTTAAQLFISNVLDGTVTRISVSLNGGFNTVGSPTTIASGYAHGPDGMGLVVGPAGLAYDSSEDILYVAAEGDNEIFAITDASDLNSTAGMGTPIFADQNHLHGPLGLMIAPNGNLVTANAGPAAHVDSAQPSELVEFTADGEFVRQFSIDPNTGSAFAILNVPSLVANQFAYVDDFSSILNITRFAK